MIENLSREAIKKAVAKEGFSLDKFNEICGKKKKTEKEKKDFEKFVHHFAFRI